MKKLLMMSLVLLVPTSAQAGFSIMNGSAPTAPAVTAAPVEKVTTVSRVRARPALEIINERYVPDDIKKKYSMPDDYFEMTKPATVSPVVKAAPETDTLPLPLMAPPVAALSPAPMPAPAPAPLPPAAPPVEIAALPATAPAAITIPAPKALVVEDTVKAPPPVPVPSERVDTWRARKGESMRDILKRWSDRVGTEFVWTAAESPKISEEFSYVGTFQDATTKLMAKNAGQLKMKFADQAPVSDETQPMATIPLIPQDNALDDMRVSDPDMDMAATPSDNDRTWFASSGASLEAVLRAWAETEGASLIWQADQNFAVKKAFSKKGEFEDALMQVLTQYDGQKLRPVGRLYRNPISGEKVLVIKADKS